MMTVVSGEVKTGCSLLSADEGRHIAMTVVSGGVKTDCSLLM